MEKEIQTTKRDLIWSIVMRMNSTDLEKFTVKEIQDDLHETEISEDTIRSVLTAMENLGHITHTQNSPYYHLD